MYLCLIKANLYFLSSDKKKLSNGEEYKNGDYVWVEVSPVKWIPNYKTNTPQRISRIVEFLVNLNPSGPNGNYLMLDGEGNPMYADVLAIS